MYKVLIVEDHALIRFGLKTAFESKKFIDEIFEADSGEKAIDTVKKFPIDLVIMDLGLPNINGIETTYEIKKLRKDTKIVILTSHNTKREVLNSIKAGASAYCSKDINPDRLADVIKGVIDGEAWFDSKIADIVLKALSENNQSNKFEIKDSYNLTDREKEVLQYICEGLTNSEISKLLDVSVNTIKVHVGGIFQKLGVDDRTQAVIKVFNKI